MHEASGWRGYRLEGDVIHMGARLYHYSTACFLSADPLGHASDMSLYSYANNDPVNAVDPEGRFLHVLIGAGVGGLVGIGSQLISDAFRGKMSGLDDYAGAFVGGAVTGAVITASGGTSLVGMAIAGGSGAAAGNITSQSLSNEPFNPSELTVTTIIGTTTAMIPAPVFKIPGLNAGNGSWAHVADTQMTKLANGTTSAVSTTTLGKIIGANVYRESTSIAIDGAADAGYLQWIKPRLDPISTLSTSFNTSSGSSKGMHK
ncbi:MAG: RHS repeat-associated core domain-containing protein [Verrucomicrobiae bacterium]|nr:RHS repeat-associated core domain-containing protein [Verrucomicrobiae bacterium]